MLNNRVEVREPYRQPTVGWILVLVSLNLIFLAVICFFSLSANKWTDPELNEFKLSLHPAVLALMGGSSLYLAYLVFSVGRCLTAKSARRMLELDSRPPIIHLRSFKNDKSVGFSAGMEPPDLSTVCKRIGPFVALGIPGETLQSHGASRLYCGENNWQHKVFELFRGASLVIITPGDSPSLNWELMQVRDHVDPTKILIYLPSGWNRKETCDSARRMVAESFSRELPRDLGKCAFIWFSDDWEPILLGKNGPSWSVRLRGQWNPFSDCYFFRDCLVPVLNKHGLAIPRLGIHWCEWIFMMMFLYVVAYVYSYW